MAENQDNMMHEVAKEALAKFMLGRVKTVKATCGKEWAPSIISMDGSDIAGRSLCPFCFVTHAFAA